MSSFVSSPVWGAVISTLGTVLSGIAVLIVRVLGKVSRMEDKLIAIAQDVSEIKNDDDIVRWSEIGRNRANRRGHVR